MSAQKRRRKEAAPFQVLLIDDHPIVRKGVAEIIEEEGDMTVCAEADSFPQALEILKEIEANFIIADLSYKERDLAGLDLMDHLRSQDAKIPVLILSMHDEELFAERLLRAGAQGYLMKEEPLEKVVQAIRQIDEKGFYVSEKMTTKVLASLYRGENNQGAPLDQLTNREMQVFHLLGQGKTPTQIAENLCLSPKTISTYQTRMKDKLNLDTNRELLQYAIQWQITGGE